MNVVLAGGLLLAALGPSIALLVMGIAVVGIAVTGLRTTINSLATTSAPGNRAGAASLALSLQFFGGSLAPVGWVPAYTAFGGAGFAATAVIPVLAVVLLAAGALGPATTGSESGQSHRLPGRASETDSRQNCDSGVLDLQATARPGTGIRIRSCATTTSPPYTAPASSRNFVASV
jgi:MFS family permease